MDAKRLTVRFNLQNEEDRRAWEFLHNRDAASISKEVIRIVNSAERYENLETLIRQTIEDALRGRIVPDAQAESPDDEENDAIVAEFLDSFF